MTAVESIIRFFRAVDTRSWEVVRATLGDSLVVDYTSLFGGSPERLTGDDLVAQWRGLLPGFDVTQHFVGTLIETAPQTFEANVRGYHRLGVDVWMVAGWYALTTATDDDGRHRITGITLLVTYETGDRALVERAREAAGTE